MTLMVAGLVILAVSLVWHTGLAALSARAANQLFAGPTPAADAAAADRAPDSSAAPRVLWLVLINPSPVGLAAARAVRLRPRCRTRVLVVGSRPAEHELPDHPEAHCLAVRPNLDRSELLNHAYRLVRRLSHRYGEDPSRAVFGIIDDGACPDDGLAVAVWRAFAEARVAAVQARVETVGAGALHAAQQYEHGVLADAANLLRAPRGASHLGVNGAFVRLSELARLGPRPWRAGAAEGHDLGVRLCRLGVDIRHDPRLRVVVGSVHQRHLLRQQARVIQGQLQAGPSRPVRSRSRWVCWALRVGGRPVPGAIVMWGVAAFAYAARRLASGDSTAPADLPWWHLALGGALGDTPSWSALGRAAAIWLGAAVAPAIVWWAARRDLAAGTLVRGALARPLLLLLTPIALGIAVVRSVVGCRTWGAREARTTLPLEAVGGRVLVCERSVFLDTTGLRRRRMWTVAYGSGLAGMAYVVAFVYALVSHPVALNRDVAGAADRPPGHSIASPTAASTPAPDPTPATASPAGVTARRQSAVRTTPDGTMGAVPEPSMPVPPSASPWPAPSSFPSPSRAASPSRSSRRDDAGPGRSIGAVRSGREA